MRALRRLQAADATVGLVVLVQCIVLFAVNESGSFYSDDFMLFGQAADASLGYGYLSNIAFQHLVPALRLATWLQLNTVGLDWTVAQVSVVLCVGITSLTFYALVKLLTERPWLAVAATAFVGLTLFNQVGSRWWSSALSVYPLITAVALTCLFYLLFLRSGRRWHLAVAVVAFAGACFCHQSAPFAFLYLLLLRLLAADRRLLPFAGRVQPAAMRWRHLGWFVALCAALLAYYRLVPEIGYLSSPGTMPTARRTATSLFDVFIPGVAGVRPAIDATTFGEVAANVILIGAALASIALAPRTLRIWIGFGVLYAANIALLVYQRMSLFGPTIVYDLNSVLDMQRDWTFHTDPPKAFLQTFTAAVEREEAKPVSEHPALLDRTLPDSVVASWLAPFNSVSNVAPLVGDLPVGEYGPRLVAVDDDGSLVPMRIERRGSFTIGPDQRAACRAGDPSTVRLELRRPLPAATGAWGQPPMVVVELDRPATGGVFAVQPTSGPNAAGYYEIEAAGRTRVAVPVLPAAAETVDGLNVNLPTGGCAQAIWLGQALPAG